MPYIWSVRNSPDKLPTWAPAIISSSYYCDCSWFCFCFRVNNRPNTRPAVLRLNGKNLCAYGYINFLHLGAHYWELPDRNHRFTPLRLGVCRHSAEGGMPLKRPHNIIYLVPYKLPELYFPISLIRYPIWDISQNRENKKTRDYRENASIANHDLVKNFHKTSIIILLDILFRSVTKQIHSSSWFACICVWAFANPGTNMLVCWLAWLTITIAGHKIVKPATATIPA